MARSTRKSLADTAVAAAKKVLSRRPANAPAKPAAAPASPAKKAPAKKVAAKKASAKKAPAKKAPAKKVAAKKAPARKAAPKKAAPTSVPTSASTPGVKNVTAKKTAAKRTRDRKVPNVANLAVKEGEEAWTKADLDEVLTDLHEHADRLRAELHDQEIELAGLMADAGDGAGQDQADLGATSFERDHELTVVNNSREMLAQTERALARIADGSYGVCESCGNPIGKMRVMAFPRATLCLSCKQREERR